MKIFLSYRPGITDPTLVRRIKGCMLAGGAVSEVVTSATGDPQPPDVDIARTVTSCDAFVAVIGPGWADAGTESGRLIDDPTDPIRIEILTALNRIMPLVPVLMDGASLPEPYDIERALQGLTLRDTITLESADLERGCARLMSILQPAASSSRAETSPKRSDRFAAKTKLAPTLPDSAPPRHGMPPQGTPRSGGGQPSTLLWVLSILIVVGVMFSIAFVISNVVHFATQMFDLIGAFSKWL